jgi:hypothetical protein
MFVRMAQNPRFCPYHSKVDRDMRNCTRVLRLWIADPSFQRIVVDKKLQVREPTELEILVCAKHYWVPTRPELTDYYLTQIFTPRATEEYVLEVSD